ncbi:MAG: hypothetical protein U7123_14780 [Potamolinea sp.]
MVDSLYKPSSLSAEEKPFRVYFHQLMSEFGVEYEIWVRNDDFSRTIAAGVVNRSSEVVAIIYFRYGGVAIPNPLSTTVIKTVRDHLISATTEDLQMNCPCQSQQIQRLRLL